MEKYFVAIHREMSASNFRLYLRRDTAFNWANSNSILAAGEPGVETDTLKMKIGDGVTVWNHLKYIAQTDQTNEFLIERYTFITENTLVLSDILWATSDQYSEATLHLFERSAIDRVEIFSSGTETSQLLRPSSFYGVTTYEITLPSPKKFTFGYHYDIEIRYNGLDPIIIGSLKDMVYSVDGIQIQTYSPTDPSQPSPYNCKIISSTTISMDVGWNGPTAIGTISVNDINDNVIYSIPATFPSNLGGFGITTFTITRMSGNTPISFSDGTYYIRVIYDALNHLSIRTPNFTFGQLNVSSLTFDYVNNETFTIAVNNPLFGLVSSLNIIQTTTTDVGNSPVTVYANTGISNTEFVGGTYSDDLTSIPILSRYYTVVIEFEDTTTVTYQTQYLRTASINTNTSLLSSKSINIILSDMNDVTLFTPIYLPGTVVSAESVPSIDLGEYNVITYTYQSTPGGSSITRYVSIPKVPSSTSPGIVSLPNINAGDVTEYFETFTLQTNLDYQNVYVIGINYGGTYKFKDTYSELTGTLTISDIIFNSPTSIRIPVSWTGTTLSNSVNVLITGPSGFTFTSTDRNLVNGNGNINIAITGGPTLVNGSTYTATIFAADSYGNCILGTQSNQCSLAAILLKYFENRRGAMIEINWFEFTNATANVRIYRTSSSSVTLGNISISQSSVSYIQEGGLNTTKSLASIPLYSASITGATISSTKTVYTVSGGSTVTNRFAVGQTVVVSGITGGTFTGYNGTGTIDSITAGVSITVNITSVSTSGTRTFSASSTLSYTFLYGVNYSAAISYNSGAESTNSLNYIVTAPSPTSFRFTSTGVPVIQYAINRKSNIDVFDSPTNSEIVTNLYRVSNNADVTTTTNRVFPGAASSSNRAVSVGGTNFYYYTITSNGVVVVKSASAIRFAPLSLNYNFGSIVIDDEVTGAFNFIGQVYLNYGTSKGSVRAPYRYSIYQNSQRGVGGTLYYTSGVLNSPSSGTSVNNNVNYPTDNVDESGKTSLELGHDYYLYLEATTDGNTIIFPSDPDPISYSYTPADTSISIEFATVDFEGARSFPVNVDGRKIKYEVFWKGYSGAADIIIYGPGGSEVGREGIDLEHSPGTITRIAGYVDLTTPAINGSSYGARIIFPGPSPDIGPNTIYGPNGVAGGGDDDLNIVYTATRIQILDIDYASNTLTVKFGITGPRAYSIPVSIQYPGGDVIELADAIAAAGSGGFKGNANFITIPLATGLFGSIKVILTNPDGTTVNQTFSYGNFDITGRTAIFLNTGADIGSVRLRFTTSAISFVQILVIEYNNANTLVTPARSWLNYPQMAVGTRTIFLSNDYFVIGYSYQFRIRAWASNSPTQPALPANFGGTTGELFITDRLKYEPDGYDIIVIAGQSNMAGQDDGFSYNTETTFSPYEGVSARDNTPTNNLFYYPQYADADSSSPPRFHESVFVNEKAVPIMDSNGNAVEMCNFTETTTSATDFRNGVFKLINAHAPLAKYATTGGYQGVSLGYEFLKYYATSNAIASNRRTLAIFAPWVGTGFNGSGQSPNTKHWGPGGDLYERVRKATATVANYTSFQTPDRIPVVGSITWNSGTTYAANAEVEYRGKKYKSWNSGNLGNTPPSQYGNSFWQVVPILSPAVVPETTGTSTTKGLAFYNTSPPYLGTVISTNTSLETFQLIKDNFKSVVFENDMKTEYLHHRNIGNISGDVPNTVGWNSATDDEAFINTFLAGIVRGTISFNFMYGYDYNDYKFESLIPTLNKIQKNGLKMRFHALFYNANIPEWMYGGNIDGVTYPRMTKKQALYAIMRHCYVCVKWMSTNYPGLVIQYDVTNEHKFSEKSTITPKSVYQNSGNRLADITYVYAALVGARMADQNAVLFVCETNGPGNDINNVVWPILGNTNFAKKNSTGTPNTNTQGKYYSSILDGIAIQGHFDAGEAIPSANSIISYCRTWNLKFMFSEVDVGTITRAANVDTNNLYGVGTNFGTAYGGGATSIASIRNFENSQANTYVNIYNVALAVYEAGYGIEHGLCLWGTSDDISWRSDVNTSPINNSRATLFDRAFTSTYDDDNNTHYNYSTTAVYPSNFTRRIGPSGSAGYTPAKEYYDSTVASKTRTFMKPAFTALRQRLIDESSTSTATRYNCNRVVSFLWEQGENSNPSAPTTVGGVTTNYTWTTSVDNMIRRFINDVPAAYAPFDPFIFVLGELSHLYAGTESSYDVIKQIRQFDTATASATRPYKVATVSSLGMYAVDKDSTVDFQRRIHFSARSERFLGLRFFNAFAARAGITHPIARQLEPNALNVPDLIRYDSGTGDLFFRSTINSYSNDYNPVGYFITITNSSSKYYAIISEDMTSFNGSSQVVLPFKDAYASGTTIPIRLFNAAASAASSYAATTSVKLYGAEFQYLANALYSENINAVGTPNEYTLYSKFITSRIEDFLRSLVGVGGITYQSNLTGDFGVITLKDTAATGYPSEPGYRLTTDSTVVFPPITCVYLTPLSGWPLWTDIQTKTLSEIRSFTYWTQVPAAGALFDMKPTCAENTQIMVGLIPQGDIASGTLASFPTVYTYFELTFRRVGNMTAATGTNSLPFFETTGTTAWNPTTRLGLLYSYMTINTDLYFFATTGQYETRSTINSKSTCNLYGRQYAGISSSAYTSITAPYSSLNPVTSASTSLGSYLGASNDKFFFFYNTGSQFIINIKNIRPNKRYTIGYYFSVKEGCVPINDISKATVGANGQLMYLSNPISIRLYTVSPLGTDSLEESLWDDIGQNIVFGTGTNGRSGNITTTYMHPATGALWDGRWTSMTISFTSGSTAIPNNTAYLRCGPLPRTRSNGNAEFIDTSFNFAGFVLTVDN